MPRYKLIVAYDGTRFHGFQRQLTNSDVVVSSSKPPPKRPHWLATGQKKPCSHTIQQVLEDAMIQWTHTTVQDLYLLFVSRTDKGVHSRGQVVTVTLPIHTTLPPHEVVNSINSRLPCDISVESAELCSDSFDPRENVRLKQYSYTIKYRRKIFDTSTNPQQPLAICQLGPHSFRNALDSPCLWHVPWALDDSLMSSVCAFLHGPHNFAAFVHKEDRYKKCQELTVSKLQFEILHESSHQAAASVVTARFVVESAGFRRSMVRNLVGFCVDVCRGNTMECS